MLLVLISLLPVTYYHALSDVQYYNHNFVDTDCMELPALKIRLTLHLSDAPSQQSCHAATLPILPIATFTLALGVDYLICEDPLGCRKRK